MCPFRADISNLEQNIRGQLLLNIEVPLVSDWRVEAGIVACYTGELRVIDIEWWETSGDAQNGRNTVAHKTRFKKEGKIIGKLQRVACTNLLITEEASVARPYDGLVVLKGAPCQTQARSKIVFVGGH